MTRSPAIHLTGVTKAFGDTVAVKDLDLAVPRGSVYGLLGPNGAGKTTTIRIILDILGPDRGEVRVLGRRVGDEVRSRVGYLPEERGLYQKMRVADHLAFFGKLKGLDGPAAREAARRWLERVELDDRAEDTVDTLSKGMQQKLQFVSTILHDPELLILDEPFSGLDPINVEVLKEIVMEQAGRGTTVLFSTHLIEDAERLCDRVCMIAGARKVLDGTVAGVKAATGRRHVALSFEGPADFLDIPEVAQRVRGGGREYEVRLAAGADPEVLLRQALAENVRIRRFEMVEPSLREIFLERAGRRGLDTGEMEEAPVERRVGGAA